MAILIGFVSILVLSACQRTTPSPTPISDPAALFWWEKLPDFIYRVQPAPDGFFTKSVWAKHVRVTLHTDELVVPEDDSDLDEHIEIFIDGARISVEFHRSIQARAIAVNGEIPPEKLGHRYTATVRVTQLPPHPVLEYSWEFDVLDEAPSFPGLPEGFRFVRPLPDSVITQRAYREGSLTPARYLPGVGDLRNGVCVGVLPHKIVEPGEFLEGDIFHKYRFVTLDGEPPRQGADISGATEPHRVNLYDDNGEVIASYVGPNSFKCWYVDLAPGQHEVVVEINKASGERIEYTWQFTIVPDE